MSTLWGMPFLAIYPFTTIDLSSYSSAHDSLYVLEAYQFLLFYSRDKENQLSNTRVSNQLNQLSVVE